jgi:uncharacterized protein (DUF2062 family)
MNWLTDMDWGWQPFVSWRPPKDQDIDNRLIFRLGLFFGCIPSIPALIAVLEYAFEHRSTLTVSKMVMLALLVCALILLGFISFFVAYKFTFAYFWNRRARRLRNTARPVIVNVAT